MTFSDRYGWMVYGIDSAGRADGIATSVEAEAVAKFWELADTHSVGHIAFYSEDRTLWLDNNTRLVTMTRADVGKARGRLPVPAEHPVGSIAAPCLVGPPGPAEESLTDALLQHASEPVLDPEVPSPVFGQYPPAAAPTAAAAPDLPWCRGHDKRHEITDECWVARCPWPDCRFGWPGDTYPRTLTGVAAHLKTHGLVGSASYMIRARRVVLWMAARHWRLRTVPLVRARMPWAKRHPATAEFVVATTGDPMVDAAFKVAPPSPAVPTLAVVASTPTVGPVNQHRAAVLAAITPGMHKIARWAVADRFNIQRDTVERWVREDRERQQGKIERAL